MNKYRTNKLWERSQRLKKNSAKKTYIHIICHVVKTKARKDAKSSQRGARGKSTKTPNGKEVTKTYGNSNYENKEKIWKIHIKWNIKMTNKHS